MITRQVLGRGAWVDLLPGWLSGADALFDDLLSQVPWRAEQRQMYERVVDVPRLLSFYGEDEPLPHPELVSAREALNAHYRAELGELFDDGRAVPLPRRPRLGGLARRHHRPRQGRGHHGGDRLPRLGAHLRSCGPAVVARPSGTGSDTAT